MLLPQTSATAFPHSRHALLSIRLLLAAVFSSHALPIYVVRNQTAHAPTPHTASTHGRACSCPDAPAPRGGTSDLYNQLVTAPQSPLWPGDERIIAGRVKEINTLQERDMRGVNTASHRAYSNYLSELHHPCQVPNQKPAG